MKFTVYLKDLNPTHSPEVEPGWDNGPRRWRKASKVEADDEQAAVRQALDARARRAWEIRRAS